MASVCPAKVLTPGHWLSRTRGRSSRPRLEAGINFDTANIYSNGTSEEILGRVLGELARRDEIVVATKCHGAWREAPNTGGLSRKAIFRGDRQLAGLGVETSTSADSSD